MFLTEREGFELIQRHIRNLRRQIPNPSKETLAVWDLEDQRADILRRYYDQKDEGGDDFSFEKSIKTALDLALADIFKDWK